MTTNLRAGSFHRTILNVAFPFAPVAENTAGGAEQIVACLDKAIVENGGTSLVIASEDSQVEGTLIPLPTIKGPITPDKQECMWRECKACIADAVRDHSVDLLHFHGVDFHRYLPTIETPKLVTLHLPPSWYPKEIFNRATGQNAFLHCVSASQERTCPLSDALLSPIANGVHIPSALPSTPKSDFVLSLGRICPEKGFHIALNAAKRADVKMFLGGSVFDYEAHCDYFEHEIVPRLDEHRRFIGPVGKDQKNCLMSQARCVLIPSLAPETSSLVAMETLACGTPVVAFPNGALSEIVQDGVNGFLVNDETEMADAIKYASTIKPEDCWKSARARFDIQRMLNSYLRRYEIIIRGCYSLYPRALAAA